MDFNDLVKDISEISPPFNDFALREFIKKNIDECPEFVALCFREAFKLVDADLELIDYEVVSPEERVKFELRSNASKSTKPKIPLTVSHFRLVRYRFRFQDKYIHKELYMPYLVDDMLFIKGKRSMIRKVILEKTFSRISEKDKDGISVSPIRVNIPFNRRKTFTIDSYVSGGSWRHFIITAKLYHGPNKNKVCETTIVHYMLAKFGFLETLKRFGLNKSDVSFVEKIGDDLKNYEYFAARANKEKSDEGPGLFLRVKKTVLNDDLSKKFVVNLLYILSFFDIQTIDNVYVGQDWHQHLSVWKIIIGIINFGERAEARAHSNANTNLRSVDHFIDPLTHRRLETFGIKIRDIYDLLVYVFQNIDSYMVKNLVQDLYNSRLDVTNGLLVESFAHSIFTNFYYLTKNPNITKSDVEAALRLNPMMFRNTSKAKKDYIAPPDIIGDNFLFAGGLTKIRMGGRAEQRLHPSMLVVESIDAFVGKTIGESGYINPYVPTDADGAILHPDYAEAIDKITPFLPR